MTSATVTRWSRAFVAVGVGWFVCWQVATVAGIGRPTTVVVGLYGFVFSVLFGKAYALVPSYFERQLALPRAPAIHLPLAVGGTAALVADARGLATPTSGEVGGAAWLAGCLVFVATLGWTVRTNLTGRETGTGDANVHRRRVDRAANAFVPVAAAYLLVGAALPVLGRVGLEQSLLPSSGPPISHLLAAGTGALMVFAIGFRLLPRFLVVEPRPALVGVVLPAGAIAPALLAIDFLGNATFRVGAVLQAIAVTGFAIGYVDMYVRSDRRRVGFLGVLAGVLCGVGAVALGLHVALVGVDASVLEAHYRLVLTGFLGLTIVGVSYQFYPPAIGSIPGVDDRTAVLSIALVFAGLAIETAGLLARTPTMERIGSVAVLAGSLCYAFVVLSLFVERR